MNKNEVEIITKENLEGRVHYIRGQKVMLDRDLAEIYGYSTKAFNQQIKNNIEKFEEDFMFQLTKEERDSLMCKFFTSKTYSFQGSLKSKNLTSNKFDCENERESECLNGELVKPGRGGVRKLPYAFTEQGIYMLMTVLRGELAVKQSKALIRLFKSMKDYISENRDFVTSGELKLIELRTDNLEKDVRKIKSDVTVLKEDMSEVNKDLKKVMDNFINENSYKHFLIMDGKKLEADMAYRDIYKTAKKSIYVIDNYISLKTLELLGCANENVDIILFSDNVSKKDGIKEYMLEDFQTQNPFNSISLHKTNNRFHDRYIIIDYKTDNETIYHCGPSSKDAGNKIGSISRVNDCLLYKPMIEMLIKGI